jgi:hypothetical protein
MINLLCKGTLRKLLIYTPAHLEKLPPNQGIFPILNVNIQRHAYRLLTFPLYLL